MLLQTVGVPPRSPARRDFIEAELWSSAAKPLFLTSFQHFLNHSVFSYSRDHWPLPQTTPPHAIGDSDHLAVPSDSAARGQNLADTEVKPGGSPTVAHSGDGSTCPVSSLASSLPSDPLHALETRARLIPKCLLPMALNDPSDLGDTPAPLAPLTNDPSVQNNSRSAPAGLTLSLPLSLLKSPLN